MFLLPEAAYAHALECDRLGTSAWTRDYGVNSRQP
jgi:hypothetical protein